MAMLLERTPRPKEAFSEGRQGEASDLNLPLHSINGEEERVVGILELEKVEDVELLDMGSNSSMDIVSATSTPYSPNHLTSIERKLVLSTLPREQYLRSIRDVEGVEPPFLSIHVLDKKDREVKAIRRDMVEGDSEAILN